MSWTDEKITRLTHLWSTGMGASEIGRAIGVSKNAVIGKAHRLELPPRESPIKIKPPQARQVKARDILESASIVKREPRNKPQKKTSGGKFDTCQFPIGDKLSDDLHGHQDSGKCGAPTQAGFSYCPFHKARAYTSRAA